MLIFVFFITSFLALFSTSLSLIAISNSKISKNSLLENRSTNSRASAQVYASFPEEFPSISTKILPGDARAEIIKNFTQKYRSPLSEYAEKIIEEADKNGIDWRLITAIAMKESGLCRNIPNESFNCWGWGIHSQGVLKFDSYAQGIEVVSRGLRKDYIEKGYVTVDEIMEKYAHPSSTTWAQDVLYYMQQIQ